MISRSMYVLPNLNISTSLAKAGARRFAGSLCYSVANFTINRKIYDQTGDFDKFIKDENNSRNQWTSEKKLKRNLGSDILVANRPDYSDDPYNETSYYFENGLRKVYPYYYTFAAFTKQRWIGKTIFEVFSNEFRDLSPEEYEQCIDSGKVMVNYKRISKNYKLRGNDLFLKVVHRHEYPVLDQPISIVYQDEDILVVDKPSSMPVHPCGRYRHNSVHFILGKEQHFKRLYTIHRLDRLTSGLLMFGKTANKSKQIIEDIKNRLVSKIYVCKVEGEFPDSLECIVPIRQIKSKIGFSIADPNGKECITEFKKLSYNGKTSVVLCKPKTGRTHQLRVHLQYLGFPIVNDALYNDTVFGPLKGKGGDFGGKPLEQLYKDLRRIHIENTLYSNPIKLNNGKSEDLYKSSEQKLPTNENVPNSNYNSDKMTVDKDCFECKFVFKDPKPQDLVMYLHAWKYEGPDWKYETELPNWAERDWIDST